MTAAPAYTSGVVSFLDILGFRTLLTTAGPEEISRIMAIFREQGNPSIGADDWLDQMFAYTALSDCFFRGTDAEHASNKAAPTGHLFYELMGTVFTQCRLLQEGQLIRGAITFGKYRAESDQFGTVMFGPAVARAYELESTHARAPRVVVDHVLLDEFWRSDTLKNQIHSHESEWNEYLQNLLRRDDAGIWFVDYLRGIMGNYDFEPAGTAQFYFDHKELIQKRVSAWIDAGGTSFDPISEKLLWMTEYHNSTMSRLSVDDWDWILSFEECELERSDFLVEAPDHPVFAPCRTGS